MILLAACGSGDHITRSEPEDAGIEDPQDASPFDPEDASTDASAGSDSGASDSGTADAGSEDAGPKSDSGTKPPPTPIVIIDEDRPVVVVTPTTVIVTDKPRNHCTQGIGEYLTQYVATVGTCGELPDESGDYSKADASFLEIPKTCRLNKYYTAPDVCTVTTELVCDLPNGCTETRYQDFDWTPFTAAKTWFGDGLLQYSLACPNKPLCTATYHTASFPKPE